MASQNPESDNFQFVHGDDCVVGDNDDDNYDDEDDDDHDGYNDAD